MTLLIIDANCALKIITNTPDEEFAPVWRAIITGEGKILIGGTKFLDEYKKLERVFALVKKLDQAGKVKIFSSAEVDGEQKVVEKTLNIESDDPHILALARVSGARLLCSLDKLLHKDFRNKEIINKPRGKIYQNKDHAHLVTARR